MVIIRDAVFPNDTAALIAIWREFIAHSPVSLDYQDNSSEFADPAAKYARPKGCVLLAELDDTLVGCVAFRAVKPKVCEMKRLYVRDSARGQQVGRRLVTRLIEEARLSGFAEMRLDVQEKSVTARQLYAAFGFRTAEPVSFNPVPGASCLGLSL